MPEQIPHNQQTGWTLVKAGDFGKFRSELIASWRWMLQTLDETERRNRLPRSQYDYSLQERTRRAS
jgi:hypothetical protein